MPPSPSSSSAELDCQSSLKSNRAAGSAELGLAEREELLGVVAAAHELLQEALAAAARRIAERQAQLAALQRELDLPAESHLLQCVLGPPAGRGEDGTAHQESCKALPCNTSRQASLQLRAEAGQRSLHYADSGRSMPVGRASRRPGAAAAGLPGRPAARIVRLLRGAQQCFGRGPPRGEASQPPGVADTTAPAAVAVERCGATALKVGAAEARPGQGAAAGGSGLLTDAADCDEAAAEIGAPLPAPPAAAAKLSPAPSPAPADAASTAHLGALAADSRQTSAAAPSPAPADLADEASTVHLGALVADSPQTSAAAPSPPPVNVPTAVCVAALAADSPQTSAAAFSPTLVVADFSTQLCCELEQLREQVALLQQEKEQASVSVGRQARHGRRNCRGPCA